jgi:hypothetical protein
VAAAGGLMNILSFSPPNDPMTRLQVVRRASTP